jgi:hypothetical protein
MLTSIVVLAQLHVLCGGRTFFAYAIHGMLGQFPPCDNIFCIQGFMTHQISLAILDHL